MALSTQVKNLVNSVLGRVNLRLETLTEVRSETARLDGLKASGHFGGPVLPVPAPFTRISMHDVLGEIERYQDVFRRWAAPDGGPTGFRLDNSWFETPDAEVLYAMLRARRPRRIVEVGSGHSTRVSRQAILDGGLDTELVCVDPEPRCDVTHLADRVLRQPVESLRGGAFPELGPDDVLFIDSSHLVASGGDVVFLFLELLPRLTPGVLVHVHDVFLPFDYPESWVVDERRGYNEQFLVHGILATDPRIRVLWATAYLASRHEDLGARFPWSRTCRGSSVWFTREP